MRFSMVIGSFPLGEIFPVRISARAVPPSSPGYHAITTAFTLSIHDAISTPPPLLITTITFFPVAIASLSKLICIGSIAKVRSKPSLSVLLSNPSETTILSYFCRAARSEPVLCTFTCNLATASRALS